MARGTWMRVMGLVLAIAVGLWPTAGLAIESTWEGVTVSWTCTGLGDVTFLYESYNDLSKTNTMAYVASARNEIGEPMLGGAISFSFAFPGGNSYYWHNCNLHVNTGALTFYGLFKDGEGGGGSGSFMLEPGGDPVYVNLRVDSMPGDDDGPTPGGTGPTVEIYVNIDSSSLEDIPGQKGRKGGPEDNEGTEMEGGEGAGECGGGLPNYWVNTATLNLVVQDTDFAYQGRGPALAMTRTWNADPYIGGMFGKGWTFAYESAVKGSGGATGSAWHIKGSGQENYFKYDAGAGGFKAQEGVRDRMRMITDGSGTYYLVKEKRTGLTYRYDYQSTGADGWTRYLVSAITDAAGNSVTIIRNPSGTVNKITDASGRVTTFTYDVQGHCVSMTTPEGGTTSYNYDGDGRLTWSLDLVGAVTTYEYDAQHYMTKMTAAGRVTSLAWNDSGGWRHLASVTDAGGNRWTWAASSVGNTTMTDPAGGVTTYASVNGLTGTKTDPAGGIWSYTYTNGLRTRLSDPNGNAHNWEYDVRGNVTKYTDPADNIHTYQWDAEDRMTQYTDPLGGSWTYTYDAQGSVT
ncbi:MAG: hypothetical protein KKB20_30395, partial [Proteobacteria bacterium]|nr:hypothetical protein [Pseudomonadota bacterium]